MIIIKNEFLTAIINPLGAELKSLKNLKTGFEYIWQADPAYWNRSAPILFPIVGEVKNGAYRVDGNEYSLSRHGFARDSVFEITKRTNDEVVLTLKSNPDSLKKYPFDFEFSVGYLLQENSILTTFTIYNPSTQNIYFSVGAHPGFNLPSKQLENYYIEFEKPETLERWLLKDNVFSGETEPVINNSTRLPLVTSLFDKDAVVFKNMVSKKLSLKSLTGDYSLTMDFDGFPYFGIWTKPNCHEFVCLEPWCGLADNSNFNGEFCEKEGVIVLVAGQVFERQFTIDITN
ncbi:MAG: aldose 1-epimerase family protein [Bacteroidota bacterium]